MGNVITPTEQAAFDKGQADAHRSKMTTANKRLVVVQFNESSAPYLKGETAGFPPEIAERYLRARTKSGDPICVRVKDAKSAADETEAGA